MIDVTKLDVVPYPHPALRWIAKPVPQVTPLVQDVVRRMIELMHDYKGLGLAATQIAVPWRIFVTYVNEKELVFINPEVNPGRNKRDKNTGVSLDNEACLSLPGLFVDEKVPRHRDIYVSALDINGKPFSFSGPGLLSRVIQHEFNHLDGIIFTDLLKLTNMVQMGSNIMTMKEYVDGWLSYLTTQYSYMKPPMSGKPKYGTDEEEKEKLIQLEQCLEKM